MFNRKLNSTNDVHLRHLTKNFREKNKINICSWTYISILQIVICHIPQHIHGIFSHYNHPDNCNFRRNYIEDSQILAYYIDKIDKSEN